MIDFTKFTSRKPHRARLIKALLRIKKLKRDYIESQTCMMNFKRRDSETIIKLSNKVSQLEAERENRKRS